MRAREIGALVAEVVAGQGAELVDFECAGSGRRPLLRAFVEIPGGTTAEGCAKLSRKIEARLDASELVAERYTLEVSSPGLNRPLRTRRDFERFRGKRVRLETRGDVGEFETRQIVGVVENVGGAPESAGGGFWIELRPAEGGPPFRVGSESITLAKPFVPW